MKSFKQAVTTCAVAALIFAAGTANAAAAAELVLLGGETLVSSPKDDSYSWQLEYRQDLSKHLAAGISYLNEGHIKQHHRDGYTAQIWARTQLLDNRLVLGAAVGPYFFLDTTSDSTSDGFSNNHGWKSMFSLAAAWQLEDNLVLELRSNLVKWPNSFDSTTILAGVGYSFEPAVVQTSSASQDQEDKNEVTLFLGQTVVNSLNSQRSIAASLEYRRHLSRHIDWTVAGLYEGDNRLVRRDGLITQLWATQQLTKDLSVGAGAGAYFDIGKNDTPFIAAGSEDFLTGLITLTASYRFAHKWALRVSWNRVISNNQRDTDVILGGLGYLF